jgi:hypothetical protein
MCAAELKNVHQVKPMDNSNISSTKRICWVVKARLRTLAETLASERVSTALLLEFVQCEDTLKP